MVKWAENKDINAKTVAMYFKINLEKEKIRNYGLNTVYENRHINSYRRNTKQVFQQYKGD